MRAIKALFLAISLCAVTMFAGMTALADGIDLTKACSVTVSPVGSGENTTGYADDLAEADVVIDLYLVADAAAVTGTDTYDYALTDDFSSLSIAADRTDWTNADWQALAQNAAGIALADDAVAAPSVTGVADVKIDGLAAGLYLVVAHGSDAESAESYVRTVTDENGDEKIVSIADSADYEYLFAPELVSLPTKEADADGTIRTDGSYGEWIYDTAIALKPERTERFGSLMIQKELTSFYGNGRTTFVFDVTGTKDGQTVYTNAAALHFTGPGTASTTLDRIPTGTEVTVTEVYSGASYSLTSAAVQTASIFAGETASVSFTNAYNGGAVEGNGIQNHFTHDGTGWSGLEQQTENAAAGGSE